ncbi:hypothetical protein J2S03_002712 [Alicyclobacillus cycloheptanicus]|uniref:Uncharacterized protein n=1 Tax=Alicyclobacillus cycloheptanicus TaxID=1457 RepID=A0ABT9XKP6_9BACL|nr:hypothetical protein [Alicyclobacillus cycloheptanicus]
MYRWRHLPICSMPGGGQQKEGDPLEVLHHQASQIPGGNCESIHWSDHKGLRCRARNTARVRHRAASSKHPNERSESGTLALPGCRLQRPGAPGGVRAVWPAFGHVLRVRQTGPPAYRCQVDGCVEQGLTVLFDNFYCEGVCSKVFAREERDCWRSSEDEPQQSLFIRTCMPPLLIPHEQLCLLSGSVCIRASVSRFH